MKLMGIMTLIFSLAQAGTVRASTCGKRIPVKEIKAAIEAQRVVDNIPGIVFAAFDECGMLFGDSVGHGDTVTKKPIEFATSLFRMASVSKIFTTLAISQLIEDGLISREDSLLDLREAEFVRYILTHESDPHRLKRWGDIKIHHLMSHRAGISKDLPGALVFFNRSSIDDHAYPSMEEFFVGLKEVEFLYQAGKISSGIKYSNLGMNMLARIVAAYNREGLSFEDYINERILRVLGMQNTYYNLTEQRAEALSDGYGVPDDNKVRVKLPKVYQVGSYDGSIGVATTAEDLVKFGIRFLRLSQFKESRLLHDNEVITDFFSPKSFLNAGLVWGSGPLWQFLPGEGIDKPLWVGHTGTGYGERTIILVSPERGLGIVVLFNANDANREKYVKIIADAIPLNKATLNLKAQKVLDGVRDYMKNVTSLPPHDPEFKPKVTELQKFVGAYYADVVGKQNVTISDDGFLMFYGNKLIVENLTDGRFRFPQTAGILFNSEPLKFNFDDSGNVVSLRAAQVKLFTKISIP